MKERQIKTKLNLYVPLTQQCGPAKIVFMTRAFKWFWNAVGGAVQCWSIFGFINAWFSGDAVVVGTYLVSTNLAMQTYAAIGIGAGIFLVLWNRDIHVQWRQRKRAQRPEAVFRRLKNAIIREFNLIEQDAAFPHTLARSPASKYRTTCGVAPGIAGLQRGDPRPKRK